MRFSMKNVKKKLVISLNQNTFQSKIELTDYSEKVKP